MDARSRQRATVVAIAGGVIVLSVVVATLSLRGAPRARGPADATPTRIVSLAPSLTEILFALGRGEAVVGVTEYCDYPPEAKSKPKIGGYYNPNYEAIVAMDPDLVVMLREHGQVVGHMEKLGLRTVRVSHNSIDGICASIESVGRACRASTRATELVDAIRRDVDRVRRLTAGRPRPRVIVSVGRSMGTGSIADVWAASRDTLYDEVVEIAGGANALDEKRVKYATLSQEGVMALNPDVIIDVVADIESRGATVASVKADWSSLGEVAAVASGRVYVLGSDYVEIPGPRVALLVKDVARALHPDVDWDTP